MKSLKIFCDVVRRRSFSRAAKENGISQSSASQVVHQLEEKLGIQLLDRSKRPFVLTCEGDRYYEGCLQLVRQYAQLEEDVRTLHDETASRLTVASIYSVGLAHMSAFMQRFTAEHPSARVHLEYLHPARVYEAVENGEVDLGLVSYPEESRTLAAIAWRREPLVVVCHPQHPFANRSSLAINELANLPFIAFEVGLRIRSEIDRALMVNKVESPIALEFDNIENMKRAIEIDEGISILPEPTVAREIASAALAKIPLTQPLERPLGIIHRRDRQLCHIGQQFVQLLQAEGNFAGNKEPIAQQLSNKSQTQGIIAPSREATTR